MGLLSRVTQEVPSNQGLPVKSKSESLHGFNQWAESKGFAHCGIFIPVNRMMLIKYAHEIDAETILNSISSVDFWNSSIKENGWISYNDFSAEENPFVSLFSEATRKNINYFSLLKIEYDGQPAVFFAYNDSRFSLPELTETFLPELFDSIENPALELNFITENEFNSLSKIAEPKMGLLTVKYAIDQKLSKASYPETSRSIITRTIFEQLFYKCRKLFSTPNCMSKGEDSEISLLLFTSEVMSEKLIKAEICENFKTILDEDSLSKLIIVSKGKAAVYSEAKDFLIAK